MKKIVTVGGGTGSFTVLSGLKHIPDISITAIVSMADDGGSTGVLRDQYGVLPAGDVRQCLVALSEDTATMREVMNYRFNDGAFKGHNFGNIFLAVLEKVTDSFAEGLEVVSKILNIKGTVVPITKDKAELRLQLDNGKLLEGESAIDESKELQDFKINEIFYEDIVTIDEKARTSIDSADYIIIGPGDLYTSLIPNFIVDGFKEALQDSKAKIILPINLTNKQGHTFNWKVSDYLITIEKYINKKVDFILINTTPPSKEQIEYYRLNEGEGVVVEDNLTDPRAVRADLLSEKSFAQDKADLVERSFIRHSSKKLTQAISAIINQ
jgi:uncharacterized cofD-like protein